jgi:hypothetical protein
LAGEATAMIQIDVPAAIGMGSAFAAAAHPLLRTGDREHFRATLLKLNFYLMFFYSWIPVYFGINYFGWQTTHMWWRADSVTAYPWFIPLLLIGTFAGGNAGFLVGCWLVRSGHLWANRFIYLTALFVNLLWLIWNYPRSLSEYSIVND